MQNNFDSVTNRHKDWLMRLNASKCSSDLKWVDQANYAASKANRVKGMLNGVFDTMESQS